LSQIRQHTFPAQNRIKKRPEFIALRNQGRRLRTPHFYIHLLVRNEGLRLGVTVSRKIGNAVVRNRVKRLVREFFRLNYQQLPVGADISIVARRNAGRLDLAAVTEELSLLLDLSRDRKHCD